MTEYFESQDPNPVDLRSEPERESDEKIEKLEAELGSLQPGIQVILERLRPSWCKGQLEKITIGSDGLDLDYLIRTWGGHLLSIKIVGKGGRISGSHTVELYTFDPRRYGKILRAPNRGEDDDDLISTQNAIGKSENDYIPQMLAMMEKQRQSEIETLRTIVLAQQSAPAPAPVNPIDGIGAMMAMAKAFTQMKGIFGADTVAAAPIQTTEEAFPGQVMDLARLFLENKTSEPRPQIVPPRSAPPPPPPPTPENRALGPITPIRTTRDLPEQIAAMDPGAAADVLIGALGKMSPDQQDAAMESFMDKFKAVMPDFFDQENDDNEPETNRIGGVGNDKNR